MNSFNTTRSPSKAPALPHSSHEMPISQAIFRVLYEDRPVRQIMSDLLGRPPKHELG